MTKIVTLDPVRQVELRIIDLLLSGVDEEDIPDLVPEARSMDLDDLWMRYEEDSPNWDDQIHALMGEHGPTRFVTSKMRKLT